MRWLLAVGVVVLAVLLWQLRTEVAAPAVDDRDPAAARDPDDRDDDPADPDDDTAPRVTDHTRAHLTSKRAVAVATPVKPFDPWADPGPQDPRVPHLDVDATTPDPRHAMVAVFRAEVVRNRTLFHRCYRNAKLDGDLTLAVGAVMLPGDDGKPAVKPYVQSQTGQPIPPELATCLGAVISGMDLPAPDDGQPYDAIEILRLTHDPVD